jgi:acetyl-CoA carboxylase biotin carboxyl carrier protein
MKSPKKAAPKAKTAKPSVAAPASKVAGKAPGKSSGIDTTLIEELAAIAARHDLSEVEVEHAGLHIRVARGGAVQTVVSAPAPVTVSAPAAAAPAAVIAPPPLLATPAPAAGDHPGALKSPMVGTAYRRPSPDAKPFVEIGSVVKSGEKVLLVEAMKTFNEIVAPRAGTITAIFVEDGQPVEYGEPLLIIE